MDHTLDKATHNPTRLNGLCGALEPSMDHMLDKATHNPTKLKGLCGALEPSMDHTLGKATHKAVQPHHKQPRASLNQGALT